MALPLRSWLQAARPLAAANIAPPLMLGQAWAFSQTAKFSWTLFALIQAFGVLDHLFIVFANDVADHNADTENDAPTLFSGGSRVLVEGKLSPKDLATGALMMAMLMTALCLILALFYARPWSLLFVGAAVFLLWSYSFPPLRLSYRGQGEWLQGLGMGVVLPAFGFYIQSGELGGPLLGLLAATLLGTSGNIITALPDEAADQQVNKRSPVVRWGRRMATAVTSALVAISCGVVLLQLSSPMAPAVFGTLALMSLMAPLADRQERPMAYVWIYAFMIQIILATWIAFLVNS